MRKCIFVVTVPGSLESLLDTIGPCLVRNVFWAGTRNWSPRMRARCRLGSNSQNRYSGSKEMHGYLSIYHVQEAEVRFERRTRSKRMYKKRAEEGQNLKCLAQGWHGTGKEEMIYFLTPPQSLLPSSPEHQRQNPGMEILT